MTRPSTILASAAAVVALLASTVSAPPAIAGGLSFVQYLPPPTPPTNQGLRNAETMTVSPDGLNVYTASNQEDSIGVYTRNGVTGALTFLEVQEDGTGGVDGLRNTTGVAVSPDGKCVYGTGSQEDKLAVFSRNGVTGALTFVEVQEDGIGPVTGLRRPTAVAVSPDDKHVYVAAHSMGNGGATVVAFSRTPPACALTFLEAEAGDGSGLGKDAAAFAISADGAHLYVAGSFFVGGDLQGAVNVLSRNAVTGLLTFVEREYDGNNGVEHLANRVRTVAVSPDGFSVYAGSGDDNAVVVFSRNAGTGDITFLEAQRDGGVNDGLKVPTALAVSPDDRYLYVVAHGEEAVSVFRRDTTTGALRFLEVKKDPFVDPPNDDRLAAVQGAALSPAGDHLYAGNKGLVVFAVDACGNGSIGADEECDDGNLVGGDGCSPTCRIDLCGPAPSGGCRGAASAGASLKIKNLSPDKKDQLQFKWGHGDATTLAEYGSPTTTTGYVVCIYDSSANPQPLYTAAAPADGICKSGKPCWKASTSSYKYNDGLLTPDGMQGVQLKEGLVNGKASIQFKGKSINLLPPALPLTLPVTVQVKNTATGVCWEAVYSTADNGPEQFKAKSD